MEPSEYERVFENEDRHFWYRALHELAHSRLAAHAAAESRRLDVLDAGCGAGGFAARLLLGHDVVALDYSADAIRAARRRAGLGLVLGSVERLPFPAAAFDAVVSLDVLYHRAVSDDAVAITEFARVTKPGGVVLLNLPTHPWLASSHDRAIHGARRYTKRRVHDLAAVSGLQVERLGYWNCTLFPLFVAWRLIHRSSPPRSDVATPREPWNGLLYSLLRLETRLFATIPLPPGLSIFAVLRKS